MAKYVVSPNTWVTPSETSGSIQNVSNTVIEISSQNDFITGLQIGQNQIIPFEGTVYVRVIGNKTATFTTVPFKISGRGGGGGGGTPYTLPTASASIKGGVKIGTDFYMDEEVLNLNDSIVPYAKVTKTDDGAKIQIKDKSGSSEAVILNGINGSDGITPIISFKDNGDGTYTLKSITGDIQQQVVIHDGENGLEGEDGESAYQIAVRLGYRGTEAEWISSLKGEKGEKGSSVDIFIDDTVPKSHKVTFSVDGISKSILIKDGEDGSTEDWISGKSYTIGKLCIYNGNIYKCVVANSDSIFNSEKWQLVGSYPVYSQQESVIGTWTNNNTLYQKTYSTVTPTVKNQFVKLFDIDSSVDTVVNIESTCTNVIIGVSDINSIADISPVKVVIFDGAVYCKIYGDQQSGVDIFITIKYTKKVQNFS